MSSDDRFSPPGKVQAGDIFEVFTTNNEPVLSTTDFDNAIDWASRSTVRRQLEDMRDANEIKSKKAGDNPKAGEVWYPADEIEDIPPATPDIIKIIYLNPWFSLLAGGFFFIAFGFILFLPGVFGQGQYLGLFNRDLLVYASLFLYSSGVAIVFVSGVVIIVKGVASVVQKQEE